MHASGSQIYQGINILDICIWGVMIILGLFTYGFMHHSYIKHTQTTHLSYVLEKKTLKGKNPLKINYMELL